MEKIRVGMVGCGWRAEFFARCARMLPHLFDFSGVVIRNKARGEAFARQFGFPVYESMDDMLAATRPEYVVVSVSTDALGSVTAELAGRGIPVLKPLPCLRFVTRCPKMQRYRWRSNIFCARFNPRTFLTYPPENWGG